MSAIVRVKLWAGCRRLPAAASCGYEAAGFDVLMLSGRTIAVSAVPAELPAGDTRTLLTELLEHARRRTHAQAGAGVVVILGEHGRALVDRVDHALRGPRDHELGLLERAGEVLDQAVAQNGDVGRCLRG